MVAACANADRVTGFLLEHDQINLGARDRAGNTAVDLAKKRGFEVEFSFLGYLGDSWKLSEMSSNDNLDRLHFHFISPSHLIFIIFTFLNCSPSENCSAFSEQRTPTAKAFQI
jgi:hypothetical protein